MIKKLRFGEWMDSNCTQDMIMKVMSNLKTRIMANKKYEDYLND